MRAWGGARASCFHRTAGGAGEARRAIAWGPGRGGIVRDVVGVADDAGMGEGKSELLARDVEVRLGHEVAGAGARVSLAHEVLQMSIGPEPLDGGVRDDGVVDPATEALMGPGGAVPVEA